MGKKIFKWLNNSFFPLSYSLWKEDQDMVYNQIKKNLRIFWLSNQCTIHSSMNLPFMILICTAFIGVMLKSIDLKFFSGYFFCAGILIFILIFLSLSNRNYDKYVDEKYLEFSKTNTK